MANQRPSALDSIEVSLDLHSDPPVTVAVPHADIFGAQEMLWKIASDSPVKDFYFLHESVYFTNNAACFIRARTLLHERMFSVYNTYTLAGGCNYILMVEHNGKYYTTVCKDRPTGGGSGDPMIHNR
ncbi:MAG: hypothetical protein ABI389_00775 [Rhodanobacter sp.]